MIKKSVITAFLMLIAYAVLISVRPSLTASQHQWQDNIIKAQKYIYNESDTINKVLIGSSLSNRLAMDTLKGITNLSFGGQSIYDGLAVLMQREKLPKTVFIEMNVALRKENPLFTSSLNSPVLYHGRKLMPFLREDKQPLAITGKYINTAITRKIIGKIRRFVFNGRKSTTVENNGELFSKMLSLQVKTYSEVPNEKSMNECFHHLSEYVNALEKRGVTIVFYEMPVNKELCDLPKAKMIRERFYHDFPKEKYKYILMPDCGLYTTIDGVHLKKEEAVNYSSYFKEQAGALLH